MDKDYQNHTRQKVRIDMTIDEAIKQLKIELSKWESECKSYHKTKDALKKGIEALEKELDEDNKMDKDLPRFIEYIRLVTSNQIGKIILSTEIFKDNAPIQMHTNKIIYSRGDSPLTLIDTYNRYKYNECMMRYEAGYITIVIFE
jgi:predicted RNase H-like nuclease (RuvC/YqgF family)